MSKIKAGTTTTTAYQVEADTTGTLVLQTGSTPTTALTIGTDQSTTLAGNLNVAGQNMTPYTGFKNRIINGAMVIDQRNAGASVTPSTGTYTVDRWRVYASQASKLTAQQNAGSVTPPAGYANYLGMTSSSAYSIISSDLFLLQQFVEGYNSADLAWGTASAASITLSFWVRSSLTGTFGVNLQNDIGNLCYSTTYTVNSANTWEQKTITIAGPTSGTWSTTNGKGIVLNFIIGVGSLSVPPANNVWQTANYYGAVGAQSLLATNGATFYITGVQLEKGSTATSFDYRPYGTELQLCQRYYFRISGLYSYSAVGTGSAYGGTTSGRIQIPFPVPMRNTPTASIGGSLTVVGNAVGSSVALGTTYGGYTSLMQDVTWTGAMSAAGVGLFVYVMNSATDYFQCSAEL